MRALGGVAWALVLLVAAAPACAPAQAGCATSVAARSSLDDLVAHSPVVLIGKVERILPSRLANELDPRAAGHLFTAFDVRVEEALKGATASAQLRVRRDNGAEFDCTRLVNAYQPTAGDRGLFLLADAPYADGSHSLIAPDQAVFLLDPSQPEEVLNATGAGDRRAGFTLQDLRARLR